MTSEFHNKKCAEPVNFHELMKTLYRIGSKKGKGTKTAIFSSRSSADEFFKKFVAGSPSK